MREGHNMSMVQPPVRGGSRDVAVETPRSVALVDHSRRHPLARLSGRKAVRGLSVLVCATGLLAMTGAGTLAAPSPPSAVDATVQQQGAYSDGQYIVDFAYQYLGSPYVYAGNTPSGFDCSGFTQYVILNTVGIDIGHGTEGQLAHGSWVEWGAWEPGDLVYFQGTYRPGISHTGIYIGNGEIIHSANDSTGVIVSNLFSDYYSNHYYGAIRVR